MLKFLLANGVVSIPEQTQFARVAFGLLHRESDIWQIADLAAHHYAYHKVRGDQAAVAFWGAIRILSRVDSKPKHSVALVPYRAPQTEIRMGL